MSDSEAQNAVVPHRYTRGSGRERKNDIKENFNPRTVQVERIPGVNCESVKV